MLFLVASYGRGVRENVGGVVLSDPVRVVGAGVTMRGQGDKEIRFACGLAVVGCDRAGVANRKCRLTPAAPDGHFVSYDLRI